MNFCLDHKSLPKPKIHRYPPHTRRFFYFTRVRGIQTKIHSKFQPLLFLSSHLRSSGNSFMLHILNRWSEQVLECPSKGHLTKSESIVHKFRRADWAKESKAFEPIKWLECLFPRRHVLNPFPYYKLQILYFQNQDSVNFKLTFPRTSNNFQRIWATTWTESTMVGSQNFLIRPILNVGWGSKGGPSFVDFDTSFHVLPTFNEIQLKSFVTRSLNQSLIGNEESFPTF